MLVSAPFNHEDFFSSTFKKVFIYLFMAVLGFRCCMGFSLIVVGGGCSLVVWCGLFIAQASLVAEHGL